MFPVPNFQIIDDISTIVQKPLRLEDISFDQRVIFDTRVDVKIRIPGNYDYDYCEYSGYHDRSDATRIIDCDLKGEKHIFMPVIKEVVSSDMINKWYRAGIYREDLWKKILNRRNGYQQKVMICKESFDLYKKCIDELLPYFEPEIRNIVKFKLLDDALYGPLVKAHLSLFYGLSSDIAFHKKHAKTTPQILIDSWAYLISVVSALMAETYAVTKQCYINYESLVAEQNPNISNETLEKIRPFCGHNRENISVVKSKQYMADCHELFNDFMKARNSNIEKPSAKNFGSISKQCFEKVSIFFSNLTTSFYNNTTHTAQEKAPILNSHINYHPIYVAPKKAPRNDIDRDIVRLEKNLIGSYTLGKANLKSTSEEMTKINDWIKLMTLIEMRYRTNLNNPADTYLSFFKSNAAINRVGCYDIFAKYLEMYIAPSLNNVLSTVSLNSITNKMLLSNVIETIDNLASFIDEQIIYFNDACELCSSLLRDLRIEARNISNSISDENEKVDVSDGLRKRQLTLSKS